MVESYDSRVYAAERDGKDNRWLKPSHRAQAITPPRSPTPTTPGAQGTLTRRRGLTLAEIRRNMVRLRSVSGACCMGK